MEKDNQYENFKNIGIDVRFIQENADEHNNKISQFYHGGVKPETPVEKVERQHEPIQDQPKKENGETVTQELSKTEIEQMIQQQVHALAVKMQQYADETDEKIRKLESQLQEHNQTQPTQKVEQQTLEKPQQTKSEEEKNGFAEEDVSIEKMFDFSGNPSGKRK